MAVDLQVRRHRNRRGEGAQLRVDIVDAAARILGVTGRDVAVTLRAIARTIGTTAPSIYIHFDDRDRTLRELIARTSAQFTATLQPAADGQSDPVARVRAVGRAYLDFATDRAHLYRVLFERHHDAAAVLRPTTANSVAGMYGADAFGVLLEAACACLDGGASAATSAEHADTKWWVGLHGLATLRVSMPYFPWPPLHPQLDDLTHQLLQLRLPDTCEDVGVG